MDPQKDDIRLSVVGPFEWCEERRSKWSGIAKISVAANREIEAKVKESKGVGQAFKEWVGGYDPKRGTPKQVLLDLAKERIGDEV
jgi:hypothetical protein